MPGRLFYAFLTLLFGYIACVLSAKTGNFFIWLANGKEFARTEDLNSYGLQLFWPPFMLLYCLLFRDKFREVTDFATPSVMMAQTLGKLACTFYGCCYGPKDPNGMYLVDEGYRAFPVQAYDTACIGAIFVLTVILMFTFSKKHPGYLFPLSGMLYAVQKGIWEEFRVYEHEAEGNFFNTGRTFWQFYLIVLFVGGLIWLIGTFVWEKKKKPDFDTAELRLPDLSIPAMRCKDKIAANLKKMFLKDQIEHHKKRKKGSKKHKR